MAEPEIPKTMKALMKNAEAESFDYQEIPVPEPVGDEVLIRVTANSLCGSDISLYLWNNVARVIATVPFIPGHETAGIVVKCGPDAAIPLGTKVGVENHYYCGSCFQCLHGQRETCIHMGQYGHGRKTPHGGCSQYSIVPARYLYVLKRDLSNEEIAMLEPLGVAHNAIERLEVAGEDVLIIGCGPVGLLAQQVAKAMGAKRVIAVDIDNTKLELGRKLGTDILLNNKEKDLKEFITEFTNGDGIGRICECSGSSIMVNSMFSLLRKGGHIVMVGLPKEPLHVENVLQDIVFKTLTLKGVHGRRVFHTWEETENLVADRKVDVEQVISHRFPMSRFKEAFKVILDGKACKIILDPWK